MPTNPPESSRPTSSDPACHDATATNEPATAAVTLHFTQSNVRLRRDVLPQQQRRLDVPHLEQRHEREQQRHEEPDGQTLRDGARGQAVLHLQQLREIAGERGNGGNGHGGDGDAEQAAGQAEQQHLRQIHREHLAGRRADTLQDGDAAHLLLHEHAGHAGDANAAENQDDETDQAQIVLSARQVVSHPVLAALVGADADELVDERLVQIPVERVERRVRHPEQHLVISSRAERDTAPCSPGPRDR